MNDVERTVDLFSNGLTCSQAVLTVFGEAFGLDPEMSARLGRPLSGGMGHNGRTCGAITAALLILGLAKENASEGDARKAAFHSAQQLFQRFKALHGTTACRNLLGADWSTEEGTKKILEEKLVGKLCRAFVRDSALILEDLLKSHRDASSAAAA
jgi:C_GCAxxG_C_C family probable redox protein